MIYFDNAATSLPLQSALRGAEKYLTECYFNPSARYKGGTEAFTALTQARDTLSGFVADSRYELIFTSCGTEADNTVLFSAGKRGRVVATAGEHAAVYESCKALKNAGVDVVFAPVDQFGAVDGDALLSYVDGNTSLVSVMHVNNETGAVNDIVSLAERVKRKNPRCLFMSDGVQAYGKIPVYLDGNIDFYCISAHKIGGLKGTGALIKKKGVSLTPRIFGGGQEGGLRSGTENVFGAVCFALAAKERFSALTENGERVRGLREELFALLDRERFVRISPENGSPYILTVSAKGMRGEVLQRLLWDKGVAVGTGSACNSKKPYSRVIEACGYGKDILNGVLRMSFAPEVTKEEISACAKAMNEAVALWKA